MISGRPAAYQINAGVAVTGHDIARSCSGSAEQIGGCVGQSYAGAAIAQRGGAIQRCADEVGLDGIVFCIGAEQVDSVQHISGNYIARARAPDCIRRRIHNFDARKLIRHGGAAQGIRADEIGLELIGSGPGQDLDAKAGVAGNKVAGGSSQAAHSVGIGAVESDAVERVCQGVGAGDIHTDKIAGDHVGGAVRGYEDTILSVARNHVARSGGRRSQEIAAGI